MADMESASGYSTESVHVAAKFVALELTRDVLRRFTSAETVEEQATKAAEVYATIIKTVKAH